MYKQGSDCFCSISGLLGVDEITPGESDCSHVLGIKFVATLMTSLSSEVVLLLLSGSVFGAHF